MTTILSNTPVALAAPTRTEVMGLATGISVTDTISKSDIVAVVRQEAEERLQAEKSDLDRELRKLEGIIAEHDAAITKAVMSLVADTELKDAKDAVRALTKFAGGKYEATATLQGRDDDRQLVTINIQITRPDQPSYNQKVVDRTVTANYTNPMIDHIKSIRLIRKDAAKLQAKLVQNMKDTANLPALERKATAELTKQALSKSEEGRSLLESLRGVRVKTHS